MNAEIRMTKNPIAKKPGMTQVLSEECRPGQAEKSLMSKTGSSTQDLKGPILEKDSWDFQNPRDLAIRNPDRSLTWDRSDFVIRH